MDFYRGSSSTSTANYRDYILLRNESSSLTENKQEVILKELKFDENELDIPGE